MTNEIPENIKYEMVELPSKGECYSHKKGVVPVSYLTAMDENIIASKRIHKNEKAIDRLLESKILDKDFIVEDLCVGDRNAIILWLSKTGYGNEYIHNDAVSSISLPTSNVSNKVTSIHDGTVMADSSPMTVASNTIQPIQDGVSVANGTPMAVAANKVVPVQDGTATIAKSDPKDSAIFAKTGGPFDTLFNGILAKINDMYGYFSESDFAINPMTERSILEYGNNSINNELSIKEAYENILNARRYAHIETSAIQPRSVPYSKEVPVTSIPSDSNGFMQTRNEATPAENSLHRGSFDINIHGDLNLKSNGQSIDIMQELRNDPILLRSITQMISESISSKIHGGKATFNGNDMTYFGK